MIELLSVPAGPHSSLSVMGAQRSDLLADTIDTILSVPLTAVGLWARGMLSLSGFSKLGVIYVTRKGLEEVVGSIPTSPPLLLAFCSPPI